MPLLAVKLPSKLTPVTVNVATGIIPATLTVTFPLAATLTFELPLIIWLPVLMVRLVSRPPSPTKYPPVLAVIFPVVLILELIVVLPPPVMIVLPVMLPVTLTIVPV